MRMPCVHDGALSADAVVLFWKKKKQVKLLWEERDRKWFLIRTHKGNNKTKKNAAKKDASSMIADQCENSFYNVAKQQGATLGAAWSLKCFHANV